jgi:hypothetical protein
MPAMSLHRAHSAVRVTGLAAFALLSLMPSAALARAADGTISTVFHASAPADVAYFPDGTLLVAAPADHKIFFRSPDGTTGTAAGTGGTANNCNNTNGNAALNAPRGVESDPAGDFIIADRNTNCVRIVGDSGGFTRLAGAADGQPGLSGDGGPSESARLRNPSDTAVAPDGTLFIADTGNHRIRHVLNDGTMTTFAGTDQGFSGDGGPADQAQLDSPRDIALLDDGSLLIADTGNHRVRRVAPDGTITTVAGGNGAGAAGDGDPALTAQVSSPASVLSLPHGGYLVADTGNNRVRRVTPLGAIFTVAGTTSGSGGDGGFAKDAQLSSPQGLVARPGGGFTVADTDNDAVRNVTDVGAVPGASLRRSLNVEPVSGTVMVHPAGGPRALPLQEEDLVPLGSSIDAAGGKLTITVRRGDGHLDPAQVFAGAFTASQRKAGSDPITDLALTKPLSCAIGAIASVSRLATASRKGGKKGRRKGKTQRRLWVKGKGGRYRVKGRYVGALERGTQWRVEDSCTSSTVTVREGRVTVKDLQTGKRTIVRAGEKLTVFER